MSPDAPTACCREASAADAPPVPEDGPAPLRSRPAAPRPRVAPRVLATVVGVVAVVASAGCATSSSGAPGDASAAPADAAGGGPDLATSPGGDGAAPDLTAAPAGLFDPPFDGDYPVANFLDHDVPKEFVDTNGRFVTFWGEVHPRLALMTDGHSGYDFLMPVGTPIKAVADGTVTRIDTSNAPFFCPPLNRDVTDQMSVYIRHTLPGGAEVQSWYVHVSQIGIDVIVGQKVTAGQPIALSGNTGCTTAPHLHFEVFRIAGNTLTTTDPYGWSGSQPDPWAAQPDGVASVNLWNPGRAPRLWRQFTYDLLGVQPFAPFFATTVAYQGVDDDHHPNNEYLDLTLDARFGATATLSGTVLHYDKANVDYTVPPGYTLSGALKAVRLYSGPGTDDASTLHVGRPAGILSDQIDDCVRITYPGGARARFNLGGCP